jgi:hypothetical protein
MALGLALVPAPLRAASLEDTLGRNETRVLSAPVPLPQGRTVEELALDERLERLGYRRVHERPEWPGEFFHGLDRYWIYRRPCRALSSDHEAELIGLALERGSGRILGRFRDGQAPQPLAREDELWLEPQLLAESLAGDRAERVLAELDELPERVWRPVLAAEDARFFEHGGIDLRATARAAAATCSSAGSSRAEHDRSSSSEPRPLPRRSLGRKLSGRCARARGQVRQEEILQAYLNSVYLGNLKGSRSTASGRRRAYFSRPAAELSLAEAAALAAMIQGPNRLSPIDDAAALRGRRDWVLERVEVLGWATAAEVAQATAAPVTARPSKLERRAPVICSDGAGGGRGGGAEPGRRGRGFWSRRPSTLPSGARGRGRAAARRARAIIPSCAGLAQRCRGGARRPHRRGARRGRRPPRPPGAFAGSARRSASRVRW